MLACGAAGCPLLLAKGCPLSRMQHHWTAADETQLWAAVSVGHTSVQHGCDHCLQHSRLPAAARKLSMLSMLRQGRRSHREAADKHRALQRSSTQQAARPTYRQTQLR